MPTEAEPARALSAAASGPLAGVIRVPGERFISHLALLLGATAIGETIIEGLLESEDIMATARAVRAFGASPAREENGVWRVRGVGVGGWLEPDEVIDCGHAATGLRPLLGLVASQGVAATFTGDAALRGQSLGRVIDPLRRMGAQVLSRSRDRLPLTLRGADLALPIDYRLPAPSAGVKASVLLAGLNTPGVTSVIEPVASRDHAERMLAAFGAAIEIDKDAEGVRAIRIEGQRELKAKSVAVPGDPAAAALPMLAALIVPGSDITITGVLVNPLRTGFLETLVEMGGDITIDNHRMVGGEPVADLRIRASRLKGVAVPKERAPAMLDDTPLLAIAASFAEGTTVMDGIGDLRLASSDRLSALAAGLAANGIAHEEGPESLAVTGSATPRGGGLVRTAGDDRIATSFLVLGLASARAVAIDDAAPVAARFPGFAALMTSLGAEIAPLETLPT